MLKSLIKVLIELLLYKRMVYFTNDQHLTPLNKIPLLNSKIGTFWRLLEPYTFQWIIGEAY